LAFEVSRFDLSGRVAIVTGGNGGIGLGMARGLAEAGASILVAARDPAKSQAAVAALSALGCEAALVALDVADEASCRALADAAIARFGRLDILVNNAGMSDPGAGGARSRGRAPFRAGAARRS
jgi:2-deoxy-D-gluconate 3-dehydrogenase